MNSPAVALAMLSFCASALAAPTNLPSDVSEFVDLRESCDHWRGEYGFDEERRRDIDWAICQSCTGTDAKLARLKLKYKGNAMVLEQLGEFEPRIEPKDKKQAQEFCQSTRKPAWVK